MNENVLIVEQLDDATAVLTLNRPERRNALSIELMESLCAALESFAEQEQFRVLVLRGAGAAFCSGLDLVRSGGRRTGRRTALCVARTFQTLSDFPLIAIAAAHGAAYAGGAGLMACCDFIVAAEDLRICFPEVRRGLVPALAAVALDGRLRDGDRRELLLLGEPIDARRCSPSDLSIAWSRRNSSWPPRRKSRIPCSRAARRPCGKRNACCGTLAGGSPSSFRQGAGVPLAGTAQRRGTRGPGRFSRTPRPEVVIL